MTPSATADRGRFFRFIGRVPFFLVALVATVAQAFIMNVRFAMGFFAWMMATHIGHRRQVFGRRTEYLWPLATATVYVAVAGILKLAF